MAIYSSTLIIKGELDGSDADFLKRLELDRPSSIDDKHKIGQENIPYDQAIARLSSLGDDVFVSSANGFTIVVSFALINDYAGSIGLLKKRISGLFPHQEYFLFFTETTSMLCGFVYGIGNQIIRKKYVQNGKYVKVYDHEMDIGELLPEEKKLFNVPGDYVDDYPIKNKGYMGGSYDFEIALNFLERQFNITPESHFFSTLILNRNISAELPQTYLDGLVDRVKEKEIEPALFEALKPLMKELKFKKIDFKEASIYPKLKGYYRQLDPNKRVVIRVYQFSFHSHTTASIMCYVQFYNDDYNSLVKNSILANALGILFFEVKSEDEILKLHKSNHQSLYRRSDLSHLVERIKEELTTIKDLITRLSITEKASDFFNHEPYFNTCFNKLKEITHLGKWLKKSSYLNVCLLYYSLNPSPELASKILEIIDFPELSDQASDYEKGIVASAKAILARK